MNFIVVFFFLKKYSLKPLFLCFSFHSVQWCLSCLNKGNFWHQHEAWLASGSYNVGSFRVRSHECIPVIPVWRHQWRLLLQNDLFTAVIRTWGAVTGLSLDDNCASNTYSLQVVVTCSYIAYFKYCKHFVHFKVSICHHHSHSHHRIFFNSVHFFLTNILFCSVVSAWVVKTKKTKTLCCWIQIVAGGSGPHF